MGRASLKSGVFSATTLIALPESITIIQPGFCFQSGAKETNFIKLSHGTKLHFSSQGKSTDNFFFPPELQKGFFPCIFLEFVTKESGTKYILYVGKKAGYQKGHKIVCKMEVTKGLTARHGLVGRKKGGTKATFRKERKAKVRLSKGRPSLRLTSGFGNQIQTLLNDSLPGADNTTEKPNPSHYRL